MKLLLDQNLSRRLISLIAEQYPDAAHVLLLGMAEDEDTDIWNYAAQNGYTIVTKDKDFYQRSSLAGHPPKVIHLKMGNCSVEQTAAALLARPGHLKDFLAHEQKSCLVLL